MCRVFELGTTKKKKRTKNQLLKAEAMKENKMFEKAGFQKCPNGKILQNA